MQHTTCTPHCSTAPLFLPPPPTALPPQRTPNTANINTNCQKQELSSSLYWKTAHVYRKDERVNLGKCSAVNCVPLPIRTSATHWIAFSLLLLFLSLLRSSSQPSHNHLQPPLFTAFLHLVCQLQNAIPRRRNSHD
jgi:hypothetical protein